MKEVFDEKKGKKESEKTYCCRKSFDTKNFAKKLQASQSTVCHHPEKIGFKKVNKTSLSLNVLKDCKKKCT